MKKFWNFISEFLLFRWLCDKRQHSDNNFPPIRRSKDFHGYSSNSYGNYKHDRNNESFDDYDDEEEDFDMMDDF